MKEPASTAATAAPSAAATAADVSAIPLPLRKPKRQ
jgi:hypothetical protein